MLGKKGKHKTITFNKPEPIDFDDNEPENTRAPQASVYFYHSDHLGTASIITDISGLPHQFFLNLPFGEEMAAQHSTTSNFYSRYKFNGKELDKETGYYYYGARYYEPSVSQWLSVDPLVAKYTGYSPYNYTLDNPVRYIDPDGRAPGDPIGPGYYGAKVNTRTLGFILRHPIAGARIGLVSSGSINISTNAVRFSTRIGLNENSRHEGSQVNAYRHVLWQSTITNQFEESVAKQIGGAHEENPFAINGSVNTSFKTSAGADETVDLLNNNIGRQIGADNPDATMQELAIKTLDYFKENGLITSTKQKDGTYTISPTKITQEQYDNALKILQGLNTNGFTPSEQNARDAEAKRKAEIRAEVMRGPKI